MSRRAPQDEAEKWMRIALVEAAKGLGRTSPNPVVGAVLVKGGRMIAKGFHAYAGGPHAEVVALREAGGRAAGADLYTTLEPCAHHGKTPPCAQAIIEAGVGRVIFASTDPNPLVNGRGRRQLSKAGIDVWPKLLQREADMLNRPFFKWAKTGRPFVSLKIASSLDGFLATATGDSKWITGPPSRQRVHELRDKVDAIVIGAGTVLSDNPRLTSRPRGRKGKNPLRVVLDTHLRSPLGAHIFKAQKQAPTLIASARGCNERKAALLRERGIECWELPLKGGRVSLGVLLKKLGARGCTHILIEGGAGIFSSFLKEGWADELLLFLAPKLIGQGGKGWSGGWRLKEIAQAPLLHILETERIGEDVLIRSALGGRHVNKARHNVNPKHDTMSPKVDISPPVQKKRGC
ncbi:MAG: bifunctional diaminohydroxyphosphoribosylaminopyrimidine deaminase/5-amino-6-(5-phosphoribosylamino)uracil reductase RibD [Proteobacteria bacterium]|nr:bifunctional diaminohydroxyphosphoribosylaminopyrimidine deaminase/5-amino-6-(5-phosphoribosylamino)uracil reductase RibD [Cystobacterineae bacterium]MCL2258300.1 bifunctional diaminohydroxyphosphoribosylaminopyrimidine deaminase/5-amino-6-(5-phosphoribosylamino)uracil reductase RibD [Cystobacterineae bacterium]MCL2315074.1 bifunctional diaminohydroxyphosphoribosylaminopyrimidine deaminase/5-amino-6-(5-phosphoribosylamino)uracil reductase RibD [Pseudomonadota bacterium]